MFVAALEAQPHLPSRRLPDIALPVTPLPAPPVTEWWRNGGPRLRPQSGRVMAAIEAGIARSATFRALVDQIESAPVVVYVTFDPHLKRGLDGALAFLGDAPPYRYLRVSLNQTLSGNELIATIGHELHHVAEVLAHPDVRSEAALAALYRRIGHGTRTARMDGWETTAAMDAAALVRREISGRGASGTPSAPSPGSSIAASRR
ncbi:MAG: hypothetical protein IT178_12480 [Acidobacteria bacterium]|nr:hypothetical protein [Acidobacteriota bacterium]